MSVQVADPDASRAVFDQELANYRANETSYRASGWLLLEATFPRVVAALVGVHLGSFPPVLFGLELDYANYPVDPPSLRFINPFTGEEVPFEKLPNHLPRGRKLTLAVPGAPEGVTQEVVLPESDLVQHHEGGPAFLCHPGVREYHTHPAHTGDAWELHPGEGRLNRIFDIIHRFGVVPVVGGVQVTVNYLIREPSA